MSSNSDPMFEQYADMDFEDAKPVSQIPALAKLQAEHGKKTRVTIRIDSDTLAVFKAKAAMCNGNYQTMMNEALRQFAHGMTLSDMVRETIKTELHKGTA